MKKLDGKVAIVTGSSRGIGKAIALEFARNGAKVVVNYFKSKEEAENVVAEIKKTGADAIAVMADVSDERQVKKLFEEAVKKFGRIDILVNNAGVYIHNEATEFNEKNWNDTLNTNLKSVMLCTKEATANMQNHKSGAIVNISSIYGATNFAGAPVYGASKAGVIYLTKRFAKEFGPNIRVNAIAPGMIDTDMTAGDPKGIESCSKEAALKRIGKPEEIAKIALFLASDDSSYITGEVIIADGGYNLHE
ncbi:MAG: 3-oxoacyl-ACP reductase family protein [Candidatus Aenigmatarchaeota archaeon]